MLPITTPRVKPGSRSLDNSMTKARALPGRQVDLAKPTGPTKKGNSFTALAMSDSDSESEFDEKQSHQEQMEEVKKQEQKNLAAPQPDESVDDVRSRWSQFKPSTDFPSLFQRAKNVRDGAPVAVKKMDLSIPQFQQEEAVGGPYSPKTPPWWPDMVKTQKDVELHNSTLMSIPPIPDIETAYPYAPITPPGTPPKTPPLTPSLNAAAAPTMTMAMRIKETLDTVTAERAAKAQVSPEERAERIKKSLEGLSFFRRGHIKKAE